jgi:hypothetical protein
MDNCSTVIDFNTELQATETEGLILDLLVYSWTELISTHIFFSCRTNVNELAESIAADEPLVTPSVIPQLVESLAKLQTKISDANNHRFHKYTTLNTHLLPLTNVAFDKKGKRYF